MAKKSAKMENSVNINKDNWHEQIKILKTMYPHIANPEIVGQEIKAGRLEYNTVMEWNGSSKAQKREC